MNLREGTGTKTAGKSSAGKPKLSIPERLFGIRSKNLTKTEGRRLKNLYEKQDKAVSKEAKVDTAQKTLPYVHMFRNGICQHRGRYYTVTVQFFDMNYQLANAEDQRNILEDYSDFLNYYDDSVSMQLSFFNYQVRIEEFMEFIMMDMKDDGYDDIRSEYHEMLHEQLTKGNNGIIKTKFLTIGTHEKNYRNACTKLERIVTDTLNNFKSMGAMAKRLDGIERLRVMHDLCNMDSKEPFNLTYDDILKSGNSTQDFVAPTGFAFQDANYFRMGRMYGCVSYLQITTPELSDKMLAEMLDVDSSIVINIHIQPVNTQKALKMLKRKKSDIQKSKIEEQKKAVRSGYDMDILPTDILTFEDGASKLVNDLQANNEKYYIVSFLIMNVARTKQELDANVFNISGVCQARNCNLRRMQYMQEEGLISSFPLGVNASEQERGLKTSDIAVMMPFTTQELFDGGHSLYYGLNAISNNMIMVDRKKLPAPNGLFLGRTGSGKSFAAKREILNTFLMDDDDIVICDPEGEYSPIVAKLNGTVVKMAPTSHDYMNPLDLHLTKHSTADDIQSALALKVNLFTSMVEIIKHGNLPDGAESVIDRCLTIAYQKYMETLNDADIPILTDFQNALKTDRNVDGTYNNVAQSIASSLDIYVNGTQNYFNHRTNIKTHNRVICFDIKDIGVNLKQMGMLFVQDHVWNRVQANKGRKYTRYYIDEFHLLLRDPQTSQYMVEIWKRFRKFGGIPTGMTQNVSDLLASRKIEAILTNSPFILMFEQEGEDREELARRKDISPHQLSYITNSGVGEGLLFYGSVVLPFVDRFPKDTECYRIMQTTPMEETDPDEELTEDGEADGKEI